MTRKELYAKIKEMNLAETIKKHFGDNYTRVSNCSLEKFITENTQKTKPAAKKAAKADKQEVKPVEEKREYGKMIEPFIALISVLQNNRVISKSDAENITDLCS